MYRSHVLVCGGTGCTSSGSPQIMDALKNELKRQGLEEEVAVVETGCHGLCALGPIMIVYPDATFYSMVQPGDIPEIVSEHLLKGRVVTRLLYQETVSPTGGIKALSDTDFYKKQHRMGIALQHGTVHKCAGIALVCITADILLVCVVLTAELPF